MPEENITDESADIDIDFIEEHLLIFDMHLRLLLQATKAGWAGYAAHTQKPVKGRTA